MNIIFVYNAQMNEWAIVGVDTEPGIDSILRWKFSGFLGFIRLLAGLQVRHPRGHHWLLWYVLVQRNADHHDRQPTVR